MRKYAPPSSITRMCLLDSISHKYINRALNEAKASVKTRRMFRFIYNTASAIARVNTIDGGTIYSQSFPVRRGVVQGIRYHVTFLLHSVLRWCVFFESLIRKTIKDQGVLMSGWDVSFSFSCHSTYFLRWITFSLMLKTLNWIELKDDTCIHTNTSFPPYFFGLVEVNVRVESSLTYPTRILSTECSWCSGSLDGPFLSSRWFRLYLFEISIILIDFNTVPTVFRIQCWIFFIIKSYTHWYIYNTYT